MGTKVTDICHTRVECSRTSTEQFVFAVVVLCHKHDLNMEDRDAA